MTSRIALRVFKNKVLAPAAARPEIATPGEGGEDGEEEENVLFAGSFDPFHRGARTHTAARPPPQKPRG